MASAAAVTAEQPTPEVISWLKTLPLAPEYHPTLAEFQDPIGYIFKIEKEASKYGICKIVAPVGTSPKKTVIANFNRSLALRSGSYNPKSPPTFTTRQQQIGFCPRKNRPVQKPVWQSGEKYTLSQFEAKAKSFEKNYLKKCSKKVLSALEMETLYWKENGDKPFSVEYANDMPGSAFVPVSARNRETGEAATVGETAWNMRGVSRAKGSLLRFMKEEIPGVTSPMVYVAMMFSWFAWHVEDHDLHSLNYMHMGAGKTWYGVPRDAAVAFEEVIRVHGYGGEINPLMTFAILGEKTTVMSPEVLLSAGVPCCRLVQNAGEFVVTFPRAYHSGFSHGFNCGEAANIATPEWLRVAKDAAIRRASINCPPMVSHFQLLYDLALSLCSRIPKSADTEPRSSRLKDKKKGEGETLIKELFVEDVIRNNDLLHILGEGYPIVLLPQNSLDDSSYPKFSVAPRLKGNPRLSLGMCSPEDVKASGSFVSQNFTLDRKCVTKQLAGFYPVKGNFSSAFMGNRLSLLSGSGDACSSASQTHKLDSERGRNARGDKLSDQGLFSCVTCGILSFACVAIVQPREAAAQYLMSADCSIFNGGDVGPGVTSDGFTVATGDANSSELNSPTGWTGNSSPDGLFDVPIQSAEQIQTLDENTEVVSYSESQKGPSALGLLAMTYGDSTDSEEEKVEAYSPVCDGETKSRDNSPETRLQYDDTGFFSVEPQREATGGHKLGFDDDVPLQLIDSYVASGMSSSKFRASNQTIVSSAEFETDDFPSTVSNSVGGRVRHKMKLASAASSRSPVAQKTITSMGNVNSPVENTTTLFAPMSDDDSSRLHVFCLQHAAEVEEQLRPIGGANILLLCHPDYPELEAEAKLVAEELGIDHFWNDISFREATGEDEERIQSALESEEGIHGNGDWAVKLGINLYYSVNLSRSPLYSKQMPYNSVIYKAFGRTSPAKSLSKPTVYGKGSGRQRKIVVVGKWCGKVWMSNQVHPLLAEREAEEEETERSFPVWAKPEVKREKLSERTRPVETASATRKTGKKRKKNLGGAIIKAKRQKVENPVEDSDDSPDESYQQGRRNPRKKQLKPETPCSEKRSGLNPREFDLEASDNSPDEGYQQGRRNPRKKQLKPETPRPRKRSGLNPREFDLEASDDSPDEGYHQGRRNPRKKLLKPETPSPQRRSGLNTREFDLEASDDSPDEGYQQGRGNPGKKQLKPETPRPQKRSGLNPREFDLFTEDEFYGGPSTRLRKRTPKPSKELVVKSIEAKQVLKKHTTGKKAKISPAVKAPVASSIMKIRDEEGEYTCDLEGCTMSFGSKQELVLHKRNICPVKGCGKKFFCHKYLLQHRRVHTDDRPLKCPWKGCKMSFKWAWARTEHIRVHTGARPYMCTEAGCGQTFRFVSDFSRHKRKTGHSKKGRG